MTEPDVVKDVLLLTAFRSNRIKQIADDRMDAVLVNESVAEPLQNLVGTLLILTSTMADCATGNDVTLNDVHLQDANN